MNDDLVYLDHNNIDEDLIDVFRDTLYKTSEIDHLFSKLRSSLKQIKDISVAKDNKISTELIDIFSDIPFGASNETLNDMIRNSFLAMRNFILNLIATIKIFFMHMFDRNIKTRRNLLSEVQKYIKVRNFDRDNKLNRLEVKLTPFTKFTDLVASLKILYSDTVEASKTANLSETIKYQKSLAMLGYEVVDGVIQVGINNNATEVYTATEVRQLGDSDPEWGWTIENLISATDAVSMLCLNARDLNSVYARLDNDLKIATREVDKFVANGDSNNAMTMSTSINEQTKRVAYVFKCVCILQSYVTAISIQLTDVWNNINNIE